MIKLDPEAVDVATHPFAHAVIDGLLADSEFSQLSASYPECPPASGPTGHTIHRGDPQFDAIMADHPQWRDLFNRCNSQAFVDGLVALFADQIAASCSVRPADFRFVDHIESRAEKESVRIINPDLPPEAIFVRFDFMQGKESYARAPHLDHRRRLATMLVYFDGPGPATFDGGELVLHSSDGAPVKSVPPAPNQAVMFVCSECSWHSVSPVSRCESPRRFVQIALSSRHDIWPAAQLPPSSRLDQGRAILRRVLGRA